MLGLGEPYLKTSKSKTGLVVKRAQGDLEGKIMVVNLISRFIKFNGNSKKMF